MARAINKGPKPRGGYATVSKEALERKPFTKKTFNKEASSGAATSAVASKAVRKTAAQPNIVLSDEKSTLQVALLRAQKHGISKVDARMLLLHTLGLPTSDQAWLIAHNNDTLKPAQALVYADACARRRTGEPVAYIVGYKEFYGLRLMVDSRVLDPRDDTETLVDWALELFQSDPICALDLGTGSGAIALALQNKRPEWRVYASDASEQALTVARSNALALNLPVQFHQGSWLAAVTGQKFNLIVSNPPYVANDDPHLAALTHEPLQALTSGADGLSDIRQIISNAPAHLHSGGWLLIEHGYDQAMAVRTLLEAHGFSQVQSRRDIAGMERCTGAKL